MRRFELRLIALVCLIAAPGLAHGIADYPNIVIDTDVGLDDAVTLALALQNPDVQIVGIVACEGAASREKGVLHLERMLHLFNRREIALYAPAATEAARPVPPFRAFAEQALAQALPMPVRPTRRPFSPDAYVTEGDKTVVLVLGPLTNLAAALKAKPEIRQGIQKVIIAGSPDAKESWNARYDPHALAAVQKSGLPLQFVIPGPAGRKPESWGEHAPAVGPATSIAESFLNRLLKDAKVRQHYTQQLEGLHDELVFLYYADRTLFSTQGHTNGLAPKDREGILKLLTRLVSDGRQHKQRVVFVSGTLPDEVFQQDLRARKARIIAKNGRTEWFAQLLMSELHQHLGAYSVIGVKMGLRAAELLNAPQHAMNVTSHVGTGQPFSCANDGIIVSTGCTPGRELFTHEPGPPGAIQASFEYNGRRITLNLKWEYHERLIAEIRTLRQKHRLKDPEYWQGVRHLGLDVWENWQRRDLFEVVEVADSAK